MTEQDKQAIRERCEKATICEWTYDRPIYHYNDESGYSHQEQCHYISIEDDNMKAIASLHEDSWDDAKFIAHARTDIPRLLDALDERDREVDSLRRYRAVLMDAGEVRAKKYELLELENKRLQSRIDNLEKDREHMVFLSKVEECHRVIKRQEEEYQRLREENDRLQRLLNGDFSGTEEEIDQLLGNKKK